MLGPELTGHSVYPAGSTTSASSSRGSRDGEDLPSQQHRDGKSTVQTVRRPSGQVEALSTEGYGQRVLTVGEH